MGDVSIEQPVCADCEALITGYGSPDRSCDTHWTEDHPDGIRMRLQLLEVDPDVLKKVA